MSIIKIFLDHVYEHHAERVFWHRDGWIILAFQDRLIHLRKGLNGAIPGHVPEWTDHHSAAWVFQQVACQGVLG